MDRSQESDVQPPHESYSDSDWGNEAEPKQDVGSLVTTFIKAHATLGGSKAPSSATQLPAPVVIPQRRPGNKQRGFVKAYAPALEQYGIEQDTFLEFLHALNKAVKQNAWLGAIQLAAVGTSFVPNSIAMGVSMAVQVVAGAIAHAEVKWKTNSFLDRINKEFFRPRGLFCLLMSYNPIPLGIAGEAGDADAVSNAISSSSPTSKQPFIAKAKKNLRNPVAGTAEGEDNLPTSTAPLIYPETHVGGTSPSQDPKQKQKLGERLNNYFDKRSQARYAKESKGDVLSNPEPIEFKNKYLDPNSPATNGGLLGLVSGGRLTYDPEKTKQKMQAAMASQGQALQDQQSAMMATMQQQLQAMNLSPEQQQEYLKQYEDVYGLQKQQFQQQSDLMEKSGQLSRRITRNILYLMIVDMPSDEEMAAARKQLNDSGDVQQTNDVEIQTVDV